jgi:hypothetical protein
MEVLQAGASITAQSARSFASSVSLPPRQMARTHIGMVRTVSSKHSDATTPHLPFLRFLR